MKRFAAALPLALLVTETSGRPQPAFVATTAFSFNNRCIHHRCANLPRFLSDWSNFEYLDDDEDLDVLAPREFDEGDPTPTTAAEQVGDDVALMFRQILQNVCLVLGTPT